MPDASGPRVSSGSIAVLCLSDERADDMHKRVVAIALAGPGDSGHDVELGHADSLGDVLLVLAEKAP